LDIEVADSVAGHDNACPSCDHRTRVVATPLMGGLTRASSSHGPVSAPPATPAREPLHAAPSSPRHDHGGEHAHTTMVQPHAPAPSVVARAGGRRRPGIDWRKLLFWLDVADGSVEVGFVEEPTPWWVTPLAVVLMGLICLYIWWHVTR
jgi:hypothetical protein